MHSNGLFDTDVGGAIVVAKLLSIILLPVLEVRVLEECKELIELRELRALRWKMPFKLPELPFNEVVPLDVSDGEVLFVLKLEGTGRAIGAFFCDWFDDGSELERI